MEIEKIFRPSKWFVGFCGALVVVWFGLQTVASMRLSDDAKFEAEKMFSWSWPQVDYKSEAEITDAKIVRKTDTDAIVEVKGRQTLIPLEPSADSRAENVDCAARLTLYKLSNHWMIGRVELQ